MLVTTRIGYLFLKQQTQPGMYPGGVRGGWQGGAPTTYKFKFKLKKKTHFVDMISTVLCTYLADAINHHKWLMTGALIL